MAASSAGQFDLKALAQPDEAATLARLDALAQLLDSAFVLPGTKVRVGLDSIIGLVPGVGDLVSAALSSYIVWEARRLGLPRWKIARMSLNVAVDAAIGIVPFVGDMADVFFKANRRNVAILRAHLEKTGIRPAASPLGGGRGPVIEGEYRVEPRR